MGMFNNYIKEDKLELTNVNSRIDNVEEQQLSLSYIIDNLEIGGRNLLTDTQSGKDWVGYTSFENGEFYIDNPTGKSDVILSGPKNMILEPGKYTISFEFKTAGFTPYNSGNNGVQIWILDNDYDPAFNQILQYSELSINEYKKYSCTFIANTKYDKAYIRIDNDGNVDNTGHTELWVKNIKLERGNKATDWTPAIEDIQNGYTWDSEKNSFAVGKNINTASGNRSFAECDSTTASGYASHAEGSATTAQGYASHTEGCNTVTGSNSITNDLTAGPATTSGAYAHAEGNATVANGIGSHSEGEKTFASSIASHAEGFETIASGVASHSEGAKYENNRSTESAGQASHAEGASTYAKADGSHTEGILNTAGRFLDEISAAAQELGISGTPEELAAKLLGYGAHAEGMNNEALGSCSHAEGHTTKALANSTHAEGDTTIAFGEASHAEGYNTQAKGNQSHAEGSNTVAIGNSSHTEGTSTTASGSFSHAEGSHTEASGRDSHAEGAYNKAIGIASHAEGANTIAKNHYEHAEGKFNISNRNPDDDYPAYNTISSIGIGIDEDNRKNAFEVMQNGDIYIIGVGDYDGTNFENSLTLQETIKNTINVVRVKELFEDVTPEEEITVQEIYDLYHYSDTDNGGKFYKIVNNKYVETNENIKPNIYYKWVDTLSADKKQETIDNGDGTTTIKDAFVLDLTFDTPQNQNILNEYMIEFISGSKIPGIQIKNVNSEKIYWNSKPSLLQNALHQIHIVNNLGVIVIGV